jgi:mRNA-degrading endonuclease toxin of MazEF toxin-antitoxin module
MQKDFWAWHGQKEKIHNENERVFFHEGEIWWCSLGANIGFEQDGKNDTFERPIVVFRKFNKEIFWALPITTQEKHGRFYFPYRHDTKIFSVILSQIRLLDGKRLLRKIRSFSKAEFYGLEKAFYSLMKQTTPQ